MARSFWASTTIRDSVRKQNNGRNHKRFVVYSKHNTGGGTVPYHSHFNTSYQSSISQLQATMPRGRCSSFSLEKLRPFSPFSFPRLTLTVALVPLPYSFLRQAKTMSIRIGVSSCRLPKRKRARRWKHVSLEPDVRGRAVSTGTIVQR